MKQTNLKMIMAIGVILSSSITLPAQKTETFDIITYTPPKGWQKEASQNAVQFGTEDTNGGICLITLFKSVPGNADPVINFDAAWETIVKSLVSVSGEPQKQPSLSENGWAVESGFARYESDGQRGLVMLLTLTGNNKMVNVVTLTNTDAYQEAVESFLGSINLPKATINGSPGNMQTAPPNQLTKYIWKSQQNRKDSLGNYAGYSTNTYQFFDNGTYKFSNVTFQNFVPKFSIVDENGTFQVNENSITLKPTKSFYHIHPREKTDPASKSGNLELEATQYVLEFTTIYDRLRLVLAPVKGTETKRDGVFNFYDKGAMTRSYVYDAQAR